MNIFDEKPNPDQQSREDLYQKEIDNKLLKEYDEYERIKRKVRNLISGMDGLRLQLAEEILKDEKSTNKKIRQAYYKKVRELYQKLKKALHN